MASWEPFFNPMSPLLWVNGSDCVWIRGESVVALHNRGRLRDVYPWIVGDVRVAESMVRRSSSLVAALVESLLSWRVVELSQLQAGLCAISPPDFDFENPSIYGALVRLGAVSVGFPYLDSLGVENSGRVFLCLGGVESLVKRVLPLLEVPVWVKSVLTSSGHVVGRREATFHNVLAAHCGLAFQHDKRFRLVGGDGVSGFNLIDPQARAESRVAFGAADCVGLTSRGVMVAVEVQRSHVNLEGKIRKWVRLLAASPMSRRGLVCVFLLPRNMRTGGYPTVAGFSRAGLMVEAGVGTPPAASRVGWARWEDWFTPQGYPSDGLGAYTDIRGESRSVFDFQGPRVDVERAEQWGFMQVDDWVEKVFGVDVSRWVHPNCLRGSLGLLEGGLR